MIEQDTRRCTRCGGDELITQHIESGEKITLCSSCGRETVCGIVDDNWKYSELNPTAYAELIYPDGYINPVAYYGKHPFRFMRNIAKDVKAHKSEYCLESFGVVYDARRHKVVSIFGPKPIRYDDEYYNDNAAPLLGAAVVETNFTNMEEV